MTSRDALSAYFEQRGIKSREESFEDWFRHDWIYASVLGRRIPIKPLYGFKKVLVLHDLHHLVAGYDTTWTGELEVAAWELGSGGCGAHLPFWANRFLTVLLFLPIAPHAAWRAFRRGRTQRNLYRLDYQDVLARDIEELRAYAQGRSQLGAGVTPPARSTPR